LDTIRQEVFKMVNERQDSGLLRLYMREPRSDESMPISYLNNFPGWFKIFDISLSPFHCNKIALYHKQDATDLSWVIGIEAGHQQRMFLSLGEAEYFRDILTPDSPDFSYASVSGNQLSIEKFEFGFLLQKYSSGVNSWTTCPYVCAGQLTILIKAFNNYIDLYTKGSNSSTKSLENLKKNVIRSCVRRVLRIKVTKKTVSKELSQINLHRITSLYNACAKLFHLPFFLSEIVYMMENIREAFSSELSENDCFMDRRIENVFDLLIDPLPSKL